MKDASRNVQKFRGNVRQTEARITKLDRSMAAVTRRAAAFGAAFAAALSVRRLVQFGRESVAAFAVQEEAAEGLRAALRVTGKEGEDAFRKIADSAVALQRATTSADEELLKATTTLASLAPSLSADELVQAQKAIIGIADTFTDGNLQNAALSLGKSLTGTVDLLSRYGLAIGTAGDASERLGRALEKTDRLFLVAQDKADTLRGRTIQLGNAWGDLKEAIGGATSNAFGFKTLIESITDVVQTATDAMAVDFERAFTTLGQLAAFAFVKAYLKTLQAIQESMIQGFTKVDERFLEKVFGGFAFDIALNRVEAAARSANVELRQLAGYAEAINVEADRGAFADILAPQTNQAGARIPRPAAPLRVGVGPVAAPSVGVRELRDPLIGQLERPESVAGFLSENRIGGAKFRAALDDLSDVAKDWGMETKELMFGVGEDLVNGLISGTLSMGEVLKRALIGFAARFVLGPFSQALGIFSPSRVFADYGRQLGLGLVQGMHSMEGAVASATGGLASAATPTAMGDIPTGGAITAKIQTDDTSAYPPWALDWLASANVQLRYAGEG
jgi:hypothetical protein